MASLLCEGIYRIAAVDLSGFVSPTSAFNTVTPVNHASLMKLLAESGAG